MIKTSRQPMRFDLVRGDVTDFANDLGQFVRGKVLLTFPTRVVMKNADGIYMVPMMSREEVRAVVAEARAC
jgi:hypothetical protein